MNKLLLVISLLSAGLLACRKNSFITSKDAIVSFSADTLLFDTVFVSSGSVTQAVKVYNNNNQRLRLSDIRLMGGSGSSFAINIDGSPGPASQNLELDAGDSLYIFVTVNINPGASALPFIIQDSIQVAFNGNRQFIQLQAWGQNAHFLRNQVITGHVTWGNSLPYVIQGNLQIDTNASLTITQGCKIYLHANAPILIDGSLQVTGDKYDSTRVYFQSDRLDAPYKSFPGSWPGLYFRGTSVNNSLTYAVIRNAYQAVVVLSPATNASPKLQLSQCVIDNSYDAGILCTQSSLQASNCLISNCGRNIALSYGGNYQFTQCTVTSFSNMLVAHAQPVLSLSNASANGTSATADLTAGFTNCIFWGSFGNVDNEVIVSRQGASPFNVNFTNCLWKVKTTPTGIDTSHIINGADPLFDSVNTTRNYYDFHLRNISPALGKGILTPLTVDLDGNPRTAPFPDLGCYQRQ